MKRKVVTRLDTLAAAVSAMLFGIPAASAQTASPQQDAGMICVTVLHLWRGTSTEVANIADVPVPESYRRQFFADPCNTLARATLIEWHLAFGDEASTTKALAFLETNLVGREPYNPGLAAAIAKTRGDYDVSRLESLADSSRRYLFLAQVYLDAAEFYRSSSLLLRAERYAVPSIDAVKAARARADGDPSVSNAARIELSDGDVDALELRLAVARVAIHRQLNDLVAAEELLQKKSNPLYAIAADKAYANGDDFCGVGDRTDLATYAAACDDGGFEQRAIAWLRYRAQIDILRVDLAAEPAKAVELHNRRSLQSIMRILTREDQVHSQPSGAYRTSGNTDTQVVLRLARADAFTRLAGLASGPIGSKMHYANAELYGAAMDDLMIAETLAPVASVPGRFRQIATRFLDVHNKAASLNDDVGAGNPVTDREAAYFRAVLPLLTSIAKAK